MAKCRQCGIEYKAKRSTSSYCSPKCKQEFYRNRMPVTDKPVTLTESQAVTVTNKSMTDFERENYKPVEELVALKFNPVSKPGDRHYGEMI